MWVDYQPFKPEKIIGVFPLYLLSERDGQMQYYTENSIHGLKSPDLRCLWEHNPEMELGSTGRGSFKVWIEDRNLNLILYPEDSQSSREVFEFRMAHYPDCGVGISPGAGQPTDGMKSRWDPERKAWRRERTISEISLTPYPVNRHSCAIMTKKVDQEQLDKQIRYWRRELEELKKARTSMSSLDKRILDAKKYLKEQRLITSTGTYLLSEDEIRKIKENSPYFRQRPGYPEGYERLSWGTR